MKTTVDNITDDQIRGLATEAACDGDAWMVRICNAALGNDHPRGMSVATAIRACVRAIAAAEAMEDDG